MAKQRLLFILFILCVLSTPVSAGKIYLTNGDRLTGTVTQMVDGIVTVKTELAGVVTVEMNAIRSIQTDAPVQVHYTDGTVAEEALTETTDMSRITAINPPAPEKPRWKGDLSAGAVYSSGNTKNESYAFSANLKKRTDNDRTTLKADAARKKERTSTGEDEVTEDWWKTSVKYDYFLSPKWYLFGQGRYETDKIANLNRRIILGGGTGYQWIESDRTNLSTEVGLAWVEESYDDEQGTDSHMSAQAGYHFDHRFNETFSFINDLTYYPSTEKFSDYYLTASAELRAKINSHLFTNFKVLFDYDATPAQDQTNTDVKYIFGAGLSF